MQNTLPCLHPFAEREEMDSPKNKKQIENSYMVGKHCILELYDCNKLKLNDEACIRTTLTVAAKLSGAKLLNLVTHQFEPYGVTGLALLAESHMSIHTWPENGYAAIDVFTCGDHTMPERACEIIKVELESSNKLLKIFNRQMSPGSSLSPV